jgi:hypothetical protein
VHVGYGCFGGFGVRVVEVGSSAVCHDYERDVEVSWGYKGKGREGCTLSVQGHVEGFNSSVDAEDLAKMGFSDIFG